MKSKTLVTSLATAGMLSISSVSDAKDWSFVPTLGFQYRNLSFDDKVTAPGLPTQKGGLTADLPMVSMGLTFIYRKFYASIKYEDSFETNADSDVFATNIGIGDEVQTAVTRTDFSFTVGYNVWSGLNLFAGYLHGETELTPDPAVRVDPGNVVTDFNAAAQNAQFGRTYRQNYVESGGYLGLSYGWSILESGTLAVSGAYAIMDGSYKDNYALAGQDFDFEGDSTGFSLALTWSAPLTEHVGYYFDLRRQAYDFDGDDKSGNFPGWKAETEEVMTSITGGIQWYF